MTDRPDDDLSRLIRDAVSDVEPTDGLRQIRSRTTSRKEHTMNPRPWIGAVLGAAAAVVVVVVGLKLITSDSTASDPGTAGQATETVSDPPSPSVSPSGSQSPTEAPSSALTEDPASSALAVYYLGDGARGPVLFREFQQVSVSDPLNDAVNLAIRGTAQDPDYYSAWTSGTTAKATSDGSLITVDVSSAMAVSDDPRINELAIQQVIYTAQAAVQDRLPVLFTVNGQPAPTVLGVPTNEPLANAPVLKTLSLMSITSPAEGEKVSGTLKASGVNNSFEATVSWQILSKDEVVLEGAGIAEGWMGEKLFPWEVTIDITSLTPGTYTFKASNDDPSGGAEGNGPDIDTRTIVVE